MCLKLEKKFILKTEKNTNITVASKIYTFFILMELLQVTYLRISMIFLII